MTFTQEQCEAMRAAMRKRLHDDDLMRGEIVRLLGFSVRSEDLPKILEACRESDRASMAEAARELAKFESEMSAAQPQKAETMQRLDEQTVNTLRNAHSHHVPDEAAKHAIHQIRQRFLDLSVFCATILPKSREASLVQTNLDMARMWANVAATAHCPVANPPTVNHPCD